MQIYDLVIIGGGSAGLACALEAHQQGVQKLLILEKDEYLGGILLQCIHNGFGLHQFKEELTGPEYAERYVNKIKENNIEYKLNAIVLKITDDKEIHYSNQKDGYTIIKAKAIVSATGCMERNRGHIHIPGDRPSGVFTAGLAQKYINIEGLMVGKSVFILGSGDIGLIMARRLVLEGANVIGVAEIMPYSNGLTRNIVQCLHDYNIPLYLNHTVKRIIGKTRLEKIILSKVDENFNYIEGTEIEINVDTLLLSIGLIPINQHLQEIGVNLDPITKGPIVDESMQTNVSGVFACGNALHVHDLVDYVSEEGKACGASVSKYLNNELIQTKDINVVAGNNINYVLPQQIKYDDPQKLKLYFRVKKPMENVDVIVKYNNQVIKKVHKAFLLPAELTYIIIDKSLIENERELIVEVCP